MTADSAPKPQNTLLEEGGRSYPKAMLALSQFRGMVQDACIDAMRGSLKVLEVALELKLESRDVKAWAWPDPDEIDGTWASLGARLKEPGGASWNLYNVIWWEGDPRSLSVYVVIEFADAGVAERAWATVRDHGTWEKEAKEIHFSRPIDADGLARLGPLLDEMNHEWIKLWQGVGGVKQFLEKR